MFVGLGDAFTRERFSGPGMDCADGVYSIFHVNPPAPFKQCFKYGEMDLCRKFYDYGH